MSDVFRKAYRQLSTEELAILGRIKATAEALYDQFELISAGRETSLAKTKLEESVMWAVKAVTG